MPDQAIETEEDNEKDYASSEEDDVHTMVITLGSRMIKAAYSGEKTCRYVSEEVHVTQNESDPTLLEPGENTIPLLDITVERINNRTALTTALRKCWTEQYTDKLVPEETRLALVVPTVSSPFLNQIAELAFSELKVQALCIMTPGEGVAIIEGCENCIVLDIGFRETRIEAFVDWFLVDRAVVHIGGYHVSLEGTEDARDAILQSDTNHNVLPDILVRILEKYIEISTVIVTGSTSFGYDDKYFGDKCVRSIGDRIIKYRLPPERNKSAWLGASVAAGVDPCQHRFYTGSEWAEKGTVYAPILSTQS